MDARLTPATGIRHRPR